MIPLRDPSLCSGSSIEVLREAEDENCIKAIAEGNFLVKGSFDMSKRKRRGKLKWRSKKANHGRKPNLG